MRNLVITQPDDWHIHLRDGDCLNRTVLDVTNTFRRAIIMPNLRPPVLTLTDASDYRDRILAAVPPGNPFEPLMTLYLSETTTAEILSEAKQSGFVQACKLYPLGVTTHSESGVSNMRKLYPVFKAMSDLGLLLLIHGEVPSAHVDIFDRERLFIERELAPLVKNFPNLKIVLEHITTRAAADFITGATKNTAATITAHHLALTRNDLLAGGIKPHHYCLPILKRSSDREALIKAAISGNPKFFLGTDSAPHTQSQKESSCGCAGIYTAHSAMSHYAEIFDHAGKLDRLEAFASHFGPDFYGLERNTSTVELRKEPWQMPTTLDFGNEQLIPYRSGQMIDWKLVM